MPLLDHRWDTFHSMSAPSTETTAGCPWAHHSAAPEDHAHEPKEHEQNETADEESAQSKPERSWIEERTRVRPKRRAAFRRRRLRNLRALRNPLRNTDIKGNGAQAYRANNQHEYEKQPCENSTFHFLSPYVNPLWFYLRFNAQEYCARMWRNCECDAEML